MFAMYFSLQKFNLHKLTTELQSLSNKRVVDTVCTEAKSDGSHVVQGATTCVGLQL